MIPVVALLMVLSPASGLVFEIALAVIYGTSATVDAYRVAFLVLAFGSQLFLGLVLPNALIPVLARTRAEGRGEDGLAVAVSIVAGVSLMAVPLIATALLAPGLIVDVLGPGLGAAARAEGVTMVRAFSLVFLSMILLGGINCLLNVYRVFGLAHVNQIVVNLLTIAAVLAIGRQFGGWALCLGILSGSMLGLAYGFLRLRQVTAPVGIGVGGHLLRPELYREYRGVLAVVVPLLILVVAGQWQAAILNRVLSELPAGALASFGYAFKLTALTGILPLALATVVFPSLAELWGGEHREEARRLATRAAAFSLLVIVPVVALLSLCARDVVGVLLQHGALAERDADDISLTLMILLWSGLATALNALLMKLSYAAGDGYGPLVQAVLLALAATLLAAPLARIWGAQGVAVFLTLANGVLTAGYLLYLQLRFRPFILGYLASVALRIAISAGFAAGLSALLLSSTGEFFAQDFWSRLGRVGLVSCLFVPAYAVAAYVLKVSELATLIAQLHRAAKRLTDRRG